MTDSPKGYYVATQDWSYHVSCVAVIWSQEQQKTLLVYRVTAGGEKIWCFPGGTLESDETLIQCVTREVLEESGYAISVQRYLGALNLVLHDVESDRDMDKTTHYFLASSSDTPVQQGDGEYDGVAWVALDEAEQLLQKHPVKNEAVIIQRLRLALQ